jgi:hypothetical protein
LPGQPPHHRRAGRSPASAATHREPPATCAAPWVTAGLSPAPGRSGTTRTPERVTASTTSGSPVTTITSVTGGQAHTASTVSCTSASNRGTAGTSSAARSRVLASARYLAGTTTAQPGSPMLTRAHPSDHRATRPARESSTTSRQPAPPSPPAQPTGPVSGRATPCARVPRSGSVPAAPPAQPTGPVPHSPVPHSPVPHIATAQACRTASPATNLRCPRSVPRDTVPGSRRTWCGDASRTANL